MDETLKSRDDPAIFKLDSAEFQRILSPEVMKLKRLFDERNFEIRITGGAVRDLLLGRSPNDLDFATTATPQDMIDLCIEEGVSYQPKGERHGTIIVIINGESFDVTTLRIDTVVNMRRVDVRFTTDWKLDANRRDLTINSMYLGFDGTVYDYFYGYEDLKQQKVVFVEDPETRVREDYLRILRYFRFYGRLAKDPVNHDEELLKIFRRNISGLQYISKERIWVELKKLLQEKIAGKLFQTIISLGAAGYIGLPALCDTAELDRLVDRAANLQLHPVSYMASLLTNTAEVKLLQTRLSVSREEKDLALFLVEHREDDLVAIRLFYKKFVANANRKTLAVDYVKELLRYKGENTLLEEFTKWAVPKFPVSIRMLENAGVPSGDMHNHVVDRLVGIWAENECKPTFEELIKYIPSIMEEFKSNGKKQA